MEFIAYIILILLGLAILATLVRAALFRPKKTAVPPLPPEEVDTGRAAAHLSAAIQIPTISYLEDDRVDWAQFRRFHAFLEESYPLLHRTLTREVIDKASLLYTWPGSDPALSPIALLSHQDVVPISAGTEDDWTHPPFSGHNDGEMIWGRGAMDMKNHLVAVMEAVETLLAEGFRPARTVHLCFGHNEEVVGSDHAGASAIMETLRDRGVRLESVIDEGGAMFPIHVKKILNSTLAGIGISEKGYVSFEISIQRKGGHSAQPPKHTALGELAEVIRDLERHPFRAKMLPFLTSLLDEAGRRVPYCLRLVTCNHKLLRPVITGILQNIPAAASMMRTTTAVTMAQGSPADNVLPQKASVVVNFRQMPGTSAADVERHIRRVVRNKDIHIAALKQKEASPFSPTDSRAFQVIRDLVLTEHPEAIVAPYLVMGGTDACFYEPICDNVYRFSPFLTDLFLLFCTHATNERLPAETMGQAVSFFKRYIRTLCVSEITE
ncbi:MAG: M20/M25/M40 family metallo-hydrolase [Oscillospiraceae bacterium]|jgi:carboxypeptidase PM20D1|nr:M20/M25/M40 family metallo-hydrolase [Oscillospiraceae bacterium]